MKGADRIMDMKFPVIVLGANPYDFVNDNGERLEGLSVHYCGTEVAKKGTFVGLKPEKTSIEKTNLKDFQAIQEFPMKGYAHYQIDPNNRKRPMTITHFSFGQALAK